MNSVEVPLWLDERIYHAMQMELFEQSLSVERRMQTELERIASEVIGAETYAAICAEIKAERLAEDQARAASQKFAVVRFREAGQAFYYKSGASFDLLTLASLLRTYLRMKRSRPLSAVETTFCAIMGAEYQESARSYEQGAGPIVGVFDIDLDAGTVSVLTRYAGWMAFPVSRVSAAVYHAQRKSGLTKPQQWDRFLEYLNKNAKRQYTREEA